MATKRPTGARTKESPNHVEGSAFDSTQPLVIPKGLPLARRNRVKTLLEQNPYLGQSQVPGVVRLVRLYEQFDALMEELDIQGVMTENGNGLPTVNPIYSAVAKVQSAVLAQERSLAITIPSRTESVPKGDRKAKLAPPKGSKKPVANFAPKLRLA